LNGWRVASCGRTGDGRFEADSAGILFHHQALDLSRDCAGEIFLALEVVRVPQVPLSGEFYEPTVAFPNGRNQSQRPIDPKAISFENCLQLG
jgi:hypothetical protein